MARPRRNKDDLKIVPLSSSREKLFVCEGSLGKPHRAKKLTYRQALRQREGCGVRGCTAVVVTTDSGE